MSPTKRKFQLADLAEIKLVAVKFRDRHFAVTVTHSSTVYIHFHFRVSMIVIK